MKYIFRSFKHILAILSAILVLGTAASVTAGSAHATNYGGGGWLCTVSAYSTSSGGQFGELGKNVCNATGSVELTGGSEDLQVQQCLAVGRDHHCDGVWVNYGVPYHCVDTQFGQHITAYCPTNGVYNYVIVNHGFWYRNRDTAVEDSTIGTNSGVSYSTAYYF